MSTVKWAEGVLPSLSILIPTDKFTDVGLNDDTTGESVYHEIIYGPGCDFHTVNASLTAVYDLSDVVDLTSWSFVAKFTSDGSPHACIEPDLETDPDFVGPTGLVISAKVYRSDTGLGGEWVLVATPSVSAGGVTNTESGTFAGGTTGRYVAVVLNTNRQVYDTNESISAYVELDDFRVEHEYADVGDSVPPPCNSYNLEYDDYICAVIEDSPYSYHRFTFGYSYRDEAKNRDLVSGFWSGTNDFNPYTYRWNRQGITFGVGEYAYTGDELTPYPNWPSADSFTVEAWIRPHRLVGRQSIVSYSFNNVYVDDDDVTGFELYLNNGVLGMVIPTEESPGVIVAKIIESPPRSFQPFKWHHIVVTVENIGSSSDYRLYIDGQQVAFYNFATRFFLKRNISLDVAKGMYLGRSSYPPSYGNPYRGDLDELAIYPTALSAERVLIHWEASGLAERTMMERATVHEADIWRVEDAPGSGVGSLYRLLSTDVMIDNAPLIRNFRKSSAKYSTSASVGKEHSTGSLTGDQAVNDNLFLLRGLMTKGTVATPTNNGVWTVGVGAASAGGSTLTYGGQTTATIAYNASAAAVKAALVALSTIGLAELVTVSGATPTWTVTLIGLLSTGGALTITAVGLTGGTASCTSAGAAGGTDGTARRWSITSLWTGADDPATFEIQKGIPGVTDAAAKMPMTYISGLQFKWTPGEATLQGDIFGDIQVDPFTMATSSITDIPVIPIDPACISLWIGDHVTGGVGMPERLTRSYDVELAITGKWNPMKTLNCDDDGLTGGVEMAPTSEIRLVVQHNDQGQGLLQDMRQGVVKYLVFEALSANINADYRHRFKWIAACRITGVSKGDSDGVFSDTYQMTIVYTTELGYAIKFEIDTTLVTIA